MVISNSLVYQNRSSSANELFDKINKFKGSFFPKTEVDRYVSMGAVTYTNIIGSLHEIKGNTDGRIVKVKLK